jgi:hypothetical protein
VNRSGSLMNKSTNSGILDDLDDDVALLKEGFVPRKNVKKLLITPKTTVCNTFSTRVGSLVLTK